MSDDEEQAELDRLFDQLMNAIADVDGDLAAEERALVKEGDNGPTVRHERRTRRSDYKFPHLAPRAKRSS